ncbi:hypothetical protein [Streptomyces aureus]|uniref:hypothetical protein n=1 Tax=Streptomyces aureus TaxID=193461 RepID=UPI000567895F|nr:hypothetical protein [Streptomyces aureus]
MTDTMRHDTRQLVDITLADGVISSTRGHRFFAKARGWTPVSALRVGDSLRTPDGTFRIVTALASRFHEVGCPTGGQESRKCP